MKTMFIPVKVKSKAKISNINSIKNFKSIAIAYPIQYGEAAKQIKKQLSKIHNVTLFKQVLGCSKLNIPEQTQAILLIGSGKFHALSLALSSNLPIYIIEEGKITKLSEEEVERFKNKRKANYLNFLNSNEAGILVSLKPGQENLKKALELKGKLKNKKAYLFLGNDINENEFENFQLKSWINTACPRLDMASSKVTNMNDIYVLRTIYFN
jgi:diphthamide biosynthesis enzyme Dph1/Dph2-like protein